ncbi:cytochrome P450 9e2-like [Xylocopa sonorina]|uniref:cytochrome P450 9e2-like n=1 Tax=Xylocopa sonorina TaxID=1818115 RepID=UPI00403AA84A
MDSLTLILSFLLGVCLIYYFLRKPLTHFRHLDLPHLPPIPILGNMAPYVLRRVSMLECLQKPYHRFAHAKYFGFYHFTTPVIVIRDPELITSVTVTNFDHFCDHRGFVDEDLDPLMGKNLLTLRGDRWREMRRLLSPIFTSSKMRVMFGLISDCADNLTDLIARGSKEGQVFDTKEVFRRYANDVVASCNFGYAVDSMRDPENKFYVFAKETLNFMSSLSLKFAIGKNFSSIMRLLGIKMVNDNAREYLVRLVADTVKTREEKGIYRPDMIQLMMESRNRDGKGLTIEDMACEAFIFFLAGFDGISNLICFAIHEIAVNPEVQATLYAEIEEVVRKTGGKPTYDSLKSTRYLDAVINEVLRLYIAAQFLDRVCVKEFEFPPATATSKPITVKPGDIVWYLPLAMHRDPKYYPEPTRFDPDRFLNGEPTHPAYVPFGLGPRFCIGNRLAMLECKVALFYLVWRCRLEACNKTQIPMRLDRKSFTLMPEKGFWLKFRTRDQNYPSGVEGEIKRL